MPSELSEYVSCLGDDNDEHCLILESSYHEAARVMSPRGLQNYLEGARAMRSLNRGQELVLTYIQDLPAVVKEIGEDIVPDLVGGLMKMSSHTSGQIITLTMGNMPLVARRLGDIDVVRSYLKLIHQLCGKAPRGLRPMMENMDELLSKLTLGGLRRWALWGAQAHQRDLDGQMAYFGLDTEASRSVLQKERRGTLFIDNQRKLNFYLRALWGRAFFMRPTSGDYEERAGLRPYIEDFQIHLPDAFDDTGSISGLNTYRAAAAHSAAHMVYTHSRISAEELSPIQMKMVELFEDARIELLATQEFPGLEKLWLPYFHAAHKDCQKVNTLHEVQALMFRMAYSLIDNSYRDELSVINSIAGDFRTAMMHDATNNLSSWQFGVRFFNYLSSTVAIPSMRVIEASSLHYRDDNRYIWSFKENLFDSHGNDFLPQQQHQVRRKVSIIEMANEVDCEFAGDNAEEIWTCETEVFPYEDEGISYNDKEGIEPLSDPFLYQEWDYHVQLNRPDWVTVIEHNQGRSNPEKMDEILVKHKPIASRIRHLVDAMQPQGIVRRRGYEEGEEIDLNAAVRAMSDIRRGIMPDPRISIRITRHVRDLAIVLLLDLSESTNDKIGEIREGDDGYEQAPSILSLTRESAGLLSWAIDSIGDAFAVHGFASDGRHNVQYFRFKDFNQRYDDDAKSRLAGMNGGLSTRMGAALRHAGFHLSQQNVQKRMVLLVTDGEPADIDERDPQYLRQDAKKAVEELAMKGIYTYCMTLDSQADRYVSRIFGEHNYSIVDRVERLPERLPDVFAALTH